MDNYVVVTMEHWKFMIYAAEFYRVTVFLILRLWGIFPKWPDTSGINADHYPVAPIWFTLVVMFGQMRGIPILVCILHGVLHACLVSFSLKLWTWIIRLYSTYICICIHVSMTQNHWWFQFLWKLSILWNHVPTGLLHLFSPKKRGGSGIITAWHNPRNP